ncbi:MAG: metallophosphoesterase [Cohaesibacteraceae bacterium]|nr:metallophosphoesterase [Cohaesibacteraceae bacterium]
MKILHISDIHFGPYHWAADDALVLDKLNATNADIILNTGDLTSDSLEDEFQAAQKFLSKLACPHLISIMGNHDKYSRRSHEMFRKYIYDGEFIQPKNTAKIHKNKVYICPKTARLENYFTEVNYIRSFEIDKQKILVICLDTNLFQCDQGKVDEQILAALEVEIRAIKFDRALLMTHHSLLSTDDDPLINSKRVTDFVLRAGIEATFCGHTHELDMVEVSDLIRGNKFRQFMCGSLSSVNIPREDNMFCTYDNFGTPEEIITITRMHQLERGIEFVETVV